MELMNRQVLDLWNRYRPTIAVDAIEYDMELKKLLGTNLAEVGTDCISKKQAIDAVEFGITYAKAINRETGEVTELFNESNNELRGAVDRIKQLPPIQPKRGRWIPVDAFTAFGGDEATWMAHGNPTAFHYCSVCKGQAYAGEDGESLLTDFCPNCGADMRGD